jgi:transcriptional regulator with XRE-family HTH domain
MITSVNKGAAMSEENDDFEILERLKEKLGMSKDADLARALGLDPANLGKIKTKKIRLTAASRIKILDLLGYVWARQTLLSITPSELRKKIDAADNARIQRQVQVIANPLPGSFIKDIEAAIKSHGEEAVVEAVNSVVMMARVKSQTQ